MLVTPRFSISLPSLTRSVFSFQEYIDAHPETIVLDPLPAIRTLLDRSKSYELIRKIEAYMKGADSSGFALMAVGPPREHEAVLALGGDMGSGRFKHFDTGSSCTFWGGPFLLPP